MIYAFALMVLTPLAINGWAMRHDFRRFHDAFALSLMILIFWITTNLLQIVLSPPASKAAHPLIDFIGLSFCLLSWATDRERWKVILAGVFLTQLGRHGLFWVEWATQPHGGLWYSYQRDVNVLWGLSLLVVATPGGGYVAGRIVDWSVSGRRNRIHQGRSG